MKGLKEVVGTTLNLNDIAKKLNVKKQDSMSNYATLRSTQRDSTSVFKQLNTQKAYETQTQFNSKSAVTSPLKTRPLNDIQGYQTERASTKVLP